VVAAIHHLASRYTGYVIFRLLFYCYFSLFVTLLSSDVDMAAVQSESAVTVDCRNADGLTPLLLVCRDVDLFDRLSDHLAYVYSPVNVVCELLAQHGY